MTKGTRDLADLLRELGPAEGSSVDDDNVDSRLASPDALSAQTEDPRPRYLAGMLASISFINSPKVRSAQST